MSQFPLLSADYILKRHDWKKKKRAQFELETERNGVDVSGETSPGDELSFSWFFQAGCNTGHDCLGGRRFIGFIYLKKMYSIKK